MKRIGFRVVASMSLVFFLLTPLPLAAQPVGIWTSPEELLGKPTSGPAWDAVLSGARQNVSHPDLADQDDHTGVYVLAKAIVYTRAPDQFSSYRNEAIASIETLVAKGHPGGRTLAWGRNIGAYVMAADLLGYRSTAFDTYLRHLVTDWKGTQLNRNLHEMFEYMPNNWGTLASGSVIAIYRYLGDAMNLDRVHAHWVRLLGGPTPDVSMSWGSDMSWHADENHPLMINPAGATKNCPGSAGDSLWLGDGRVLIDGLLTAEMRRGGSCKAEPAKTGYAWEGLQGIIVAARAFERAGKPAWKVADSAIYRAAFMLQETLAWKATSNNDGWLLIFLDDAYGTSWAESLNNKYGAGRGAGWGYVLGGGDGGGSDNQAPSVNAGSDRSIEEGETLALNGSVSDDGLPDPPGGLTVRWTRLSGPGTVSFANPASASTTVTFSEPGVYQLQLEADDAEFLSTDVLTVTVQEKSNPTPPASPSGLVAIPLSASEVELRWTDESANEEAFHVEREVQGSFVEIATTDANRSTLLDTNLQPAREYRYRVRASNSTGFSNYSNEAVATTGSSQGTVKSVTPVADTYVKKDDASPHGNEARVLVKGQSFVKRTGYIKFDTSHVTGEISSAKLRLHVASHISWPDPSVIELRELVDSSWDESMNWFNRVPEQAMGAVLDTLSVPIGATTWDIDVTSYATGRRGAGANVISFAFTSTVETNGGLWIQSRETSTPPELVLINSDIIPPSNQPPTASISVDVNAGESPLTVRFDGNASSDVDGRIEQYRWDFGDGTNAEGATAEHVYTITGSYSATLTVTDNEGATGSASVTIRVSSPGDTRLGHTYPLTVVWTWGGPVPEWYAKFDLVVTRETDGELVRRVKSINPDVLWVPQLFDWNAGTEDAERGSMREHHYLHDSNGNRISLYGLDGVWNANLTDVAQPGGERYVDFAPRFMADKISNPTGDPPSEIDGVSTDGIYRQFHYWYDGDYRRMWPDVDLDGNGVNDRVEYGEAWVLNHHVAGVDHLISTLRQQMGDDKIVVLNTGSSEFFGGKNVNGFLFENSSAHFGSWLYNKRLFEQFEQDLRQPIVHMNNWVPEGRDPGRPSLSKNYYTFMRFSLARSMLFGTYFEYESLETGEQYFIKYYDEMDLDVGYPKGPMQQVKSTGPEGEGIWARFFDGGVVIGNVSSRDQVVTDSELQALAGYDASDPDGDGWDGYYRFRGGQDTSMNSGQPFTSVQFHGHSFDMGGGFMATSGDGIVLLKKPRTVVADIEIDDSSGPTSPGSDKAVLNGSWQRTCEGRDYYTHRCVPWKDNNHNVAVTSRAGDTAVYRPTIGVGGEYDVYEWHGTPTGPASSRVVYDILGVEPVSTSGTTFPCSQNGPGASCEVNQQTRAGGWNYLGRYRFETGASGHVQLTASNDGITMADAVKFVYAGHDSGNGGGDANRAPTVHAGADQTIEEGQSLALNGSVQDDGLPNPPGNVTVTWTQQSGPGTVSFANPNSVFTSATFSVPGSYQLQLEASDSELRATDVVTVTVNGTPEPNQPPTVEAGANQTVVLSGGSSGGTTLHLEAEQMPLREGPAITEVPPGIAIWANGSIGQRVTFTSSGSHQFTLRAKGTIAFGQWPQAQILIDGVAKAVFEVMSQDYASVAFNLTVEAGEREVSVAFINDALGGGEDRNLFVDYLRIEGAGAGTGGATATLIGTVGDDGLPNPPGQLTVQWTRLSGPAPVSFADPASSTTTATFTLLGDYQLQLQASDGKLQTADVLTVTVSGGGGVTNQNPTDLQDPRFDERKQNWMGWNGTTPDGKFGRNAHTGKSHVFAWLEKGEFFGSPSPGHADDLVHEITELLQGAGTEQIYTCSGALHMQTLAHLYYNPKYARILQGEPHPVTGAVYPRPDHYREIEKRLRGLLDGTAGCGMYSRSWHQSTQPIYIVPTFLWTQTNDRSATMQWVFSGEDARFTSSYSGKSYTPSNFNGNGQFFNYNAYELSRDYMLHGYDVWSKRGSSEMEGNYNNHISIAALTLFDFADRPGVPQQDGAVMKKRSKMMLDLMSLDMGMDFSANQHGGARGREYINNFLDGNINWIYYSLLGLPETQGYGHSEGFGFASSYRTPALVYDLANLEDESADYWHINMENNLATNESTWTFVTPHFNMGAKILKLSDRQELPGWYWHLNIHSEEGPERREGRPFALWIDNGDSSAEIVDNGAHLTGIGASPAYQFRNALFAELWNGDHLHVIKNNATFDEGESNLIPYSGKKDDYRVGSGWNFFREGQTAIALRRSGSCCGGNVGWGMEVVVLDPSVPKDSVDHVYQSFQQFKDAIEGRDGYPGAELGGGYFQTSRGHRIRRGDVCGVNTPGDCQMPFKRIETVSSEGQLISWDNNVMTVQKRGHSCSYDFNNWTYSGNACEARE